MEIGNYKYYETSQCQKIYYVRNLYSKKNINSTFALHVTVFDYQTLKKTLSILIRRHDIFRTTLIFREDKLLQKVETFSPSLLKIVVFDVRNEKNKVNLLNKVFVDSNQHIFRSDECPWVTIKIVQLKENSIFLIITTPHMIVDERSKEIIQNELCQIYTSILTGGKYTHQNPFQYREYISETEDLINSKKGERHKMYWMRVLKEPPIINLSTFFSAKKRKNLNLTESQFNRN